MKMPCHLVATGTHDLDQLSGIGADSVHPNLFQLAAKCFGLEIGPNVPEEKIASD